MDLKEIISEAYKIFNYCKPISINNVCTNDCCMNPEEAELLILLPLNEIPASLIHQYNDNAQALAFDSNEFKYFLPRYLELIASYEFTSAIDNSLSLKNLNFKDELLWQNEKKKECIINFSLAFCQNYLQSSICYKNQDFIGILNLFYKAGISMKPLLKTWTKSLNTIAIMTVEQMVMSEVNNRRTKIGEGFISPELSDKIMEWLRSNKNKILKAIEYHIFENTLSEDDLQRLSFMYDFLRLNSY